MLFFIIQLNIILYNINVILFDHNHSFYEYRKVKCDKTFIDFKALESSRLSKPTEMQTLRMDLWTQQGREKWGDLREEH